MTIDDRELDALVRATAPRPDPGPEVDGVLDRMASGIARRRPVRLVAAPLAVVAVLASAAAGYAIWHDSASTDFTGVVSRHVSGLELPPGTDRAAYVARFAEQGRRSPSSISDVAVASSVAHYGVCAWLAAWDHRHAAGDTAGATQAVTALNRAVEAGPLRATDGGGVVDNLRRVAAAAARGERAAVVTELTANCSSLPLGEVR